MGITTFADYDGRLSCMNILFSLRILSSTLKGPVTLLPTVLVSNITPPLHLSYCFHEEPNLSSCPSNVALHSSLKIIVVKAIFMITCIEYLLLHLVWCFCYVFFIKSKEEYVMLSNLTSQLQSHSHCCSVVSVCFFYKYFHGNCSVELSHFISTLQI